MLTEELIEKGVQQNSELKLYNLEDRCLLFAQEVRNFVKTLPKSISNIVCETINPFVSFNWG